MKPAPPKELDAIADIVLSYRPKAKQPKPRKRKKAKRNAQKRETDGKYAFDGGLDRLCICGHELGDHGAGSPPVCIFYSLPRESQIGRPGAQNPDCGCTKFLAVKHG